MRYEVELYYIKGSGREDNRLLRLLPRSFRREFVGIVGPSLRDHSVEDATQTARGYTQRYAEQHRADGKELEAHVVEAFGYGVIGVYSSRNVGGKQS